MFIASGPPSILLAPSGATFETELLTELEELNERLFSIDISLLGGHPLFCLLLGDPDRA
jgi:hypothetical protein